jgi:CheY-like chemotaxis protein
MKADLPELKELGFHLFIHKPIKFQTLYQSLMTAFGKHPLVDVFDAESVSQEDEEKGIGPLRILLAEDNIMNQKVAMNMLQKMGHTVVPANDGKEALEAFQKACHAFLSQKESLKAPKPSDQTSPLIHDMGSDHQELFDLILMDGNMPVMDGIRATKEIRRLETQQGMTPTPIIALTAQAMKGDKVRFLKAGMNDYIPKPVKRKALAIAITKNVNRVSQ